MALERKWESISPVNFIDNGSAFGLVTIANTDGFKVKQKIYIKADTLPNLTLEVKRVIDRTQLVVGPIDGKISVTNFTDISLYTLAENSKIGAQEQDKNNIPDKDHYSAVYESDPTIADRVILVDTYGKKIDSRVDSDGINRLAVDGQFSAEVDVQVDVDIDGFYDGVVNPDPDNIGLIGHTRSVDTDSTDQVQRITAKRGTVDTDTVSQDVSLHDFNGNKYDINNPIPTTGSYEKFFQLIGDSNWMKLGVYDEVSSAFSDEGRTLTLSYKESGNLIGDAVINYNSEIDYKVTLNRYINNDGEGLLLDDNDSPLNLD